MAEAKQGDAVVVHYVGTLVDGTEFDTSRETDPLEFTIGEGEVIPGFEQAVVGMNPGEQKTVTIACDDAYGPHQEELVAQVPRSQLPQDLALEVGRQFEVSQDDGSTFLVVVSALEGEDVALDANHPLAGQELTFEIELMEIA